MRIRQAAGRLLEALELSLVPGIGCLTQGRLWSRFADLRGVFSSDPDELNSLGLEQGCSRALLSRRYRPMAEEILDWAHAEGCRLLLRGTAEYPQLLNEIHDPPLILYALGDLRVLEDPAIAIVGTRRPTCYGLQMAEGLAADLGERGIIGVSGLARGIDAASHRGSLKGGGRTIAVLGSGIDVIYPREHGNLARQIREHGLLLTEFAPGTAPTPQNFPVRNRIISGLSLGTVIVEASEYSGSLITARLAMEQNREVYGVPGNITRPQSFGPNFLIKQGAKLVQSWRDIVEEFPPLLRRKLLSREVLKENSSPALAMLTQEETDLLEQLSTDHAVHFDRLFQATGLEISRLSNLLLKLEMGGRVRMLPGSLYVRVARPEQ